MESGDGHVTCRIECSAERVRDVAIWLQDELNCSFGSLVVEQCTSKWQLTYVFFERAGKGWVYLIVGLTDGNDTASSISDLIYAADWPEREAEDLFGLQRPEKRRAVRRARQYGEWALWRSCACFWESARPM